MYIYCLFTVNNTTVEQVSVEKNVVINTHQLMISLTYQRRQLTVWNKDLIIALIFRVDLDVKKTQISPLKQLQVCQYLNSTSFIQVMK